MLIVLSWCLLYPKMIMQSYITFRNEILKKKKKTRFHRIYFKWYNYTNAPKAMTSTRICTFLKPHISFYPNSCERCLKPPLESSFKTMRFRIDWFRVNGRPILISKEYAVSKVSGFVWTKPKAPSTRIRFCSKTDIFFPSGLAYRPYISGENGHRQRIFSKTLSRLQGFR